MASELTDLLEKSKLFKGFTPEQLEEVVLHLQPKAITLKDSERVYKRGDIADRCWLIESGSLTVKRASLRSPFRTMIYQKGSVTGVQGLADPGSKRVVTMIADGKVNLIEITHEGTSKLDSQTQILFWKNVSRLLLRKLAVALSRESLD
ncbi:MAG: cyclic nucleotide-binding domain-containing protein [Gammaproteobacteria bacterium]|nr:cyclic nucleotide-binding domain-containing protein [Gammaproteobacteria bacterium]